MKLTFEVNPTEDNVITCFICWEPKCDYEIRARTRGKTSVVILGLHSKCASDSDFIK